MKENSLANGKIAMIIAFRGFRDEEYFIPKNTFESKNFKVTTCSTKKGKAIGKLGGEANVDILLSEVRPEDYDAVVFVGGPGAVNYIDNEICHQIAKETVNKGKVLGAICIAPAILAKARVLEGKKATVWSSIIDKSAVKILKNSGAEYIPDSVVVDGAIVTAPGPKFAKDFAETVINTINKNKK